MDFGAIEKNGIDFIATKISSIKLCEFHPRTLAILVILEENPSVVSHFKALSSGQEIFGGQRASCTFSKR